MPDLENNPDGSSIGGMASAASHDTHDPMSADAAELGDILAQIARLDASRRELTNRRRLVSDRMRKRQDRQQRTQRGAAGVAA